MKLHTSLLAVTLLAAAAAVFLQYRKTTRLEASLATAETAAAAHSAKASAADKRTAEVRARLAEIDEQLSAARAATSETEARLAQANRDMAEQRNRTSAAEEHAKRHEEAADELRRELAHMKLTAPPFTMTEVETLQARLADAESRLEALAPTEAPEPVRATVLRVGPDEAFVVLDYGAEQGARLDQQLQVRRGTEAVATVRISRLHPQLSLALVEPQSLRSGLRKGDSAPISP